MTTVTHPDDLIDGREYAIHYDRPGGVRSVLVGEFIGMRRRRLALHLVMRVYCEDGRLEAHLVPWRDVAYIEEGRQL